MHGWPNNASSCAWLGGLALTTRGASAYCTLLAGASGEQKKGPPCSIQQHRPFAVGISQRGQVAL